MRRALVLLLLGIVGAVLPTLTRLDRSLASGETAAQWLLLWRGSLQAFGVPLALLALGLTRSGIVRFAHLGWGSWLSVAGVGALVASPFAFRAPEGKLVIVVSLVLSMALVVVSVADLLPPKEKK